MRQTTVRCEQCGEKLSVNTTQDDVTCSQCNHQMTIPWRLSPSGKRYPPYATAEDEAEMAKKGGKCLIAMLILGLLLLGIGFLVSGMF